MIRNYFPIGSIIIRVNYEGRSIISLLIQFYFALTEYFSSTAHVRDNVTC